MTSEPACVYGSADERVAGSLGGRHRLTGDQGLIHCARTFEHDAIYRHTIAGPQAQAIAHLHLLNRDLLVLAAIFQAVALFSAPA